MAFLCGLQSATDSPHAAQVQSAAVACLDQLECTTYNQADIVIAKSPFTLLQRDAVRLNPAATLSVSPMFV